MIEILVFDSFRVQLGCEAGEGLQHGKRVGSREPVRGLRERGVVGTVADVVAVAQQAVAAVFAPGDRFRGVDAQGAQPLGVFVGAARLAAAEEGIDLGGRRVSKKKAKACSEIPDEDLRLALMTLALTYNQNIKINEEIFQKQSREIERLQKEIDELKKAK